MAETTVIAAEIRDVNGVERLTFHLQDPSQLAQLLDRLMPLLAQERELLEPAVTHAPPRFLEQLSGPMGGPWSVGLSSNGGVTLSLRHPGFGWLHFQPADPADLHAKLGKTLQERQRLLDEGM